MGWLVPFGPIILTLYDRFAPERFKTEKALMVISVAGIVFHLVLYVLIGVAIYRFLAGG